MTIDSIDENAARRELWISFASLVRFYVAAAQIGLEPPRVLIEQPEEGGLELLSATRSVKLTFDPGATAGYWSMHQAPGSSEDTLLANGAFRIAMDGTIEWTGLPGRQEMDVVAERLATLILE